ncbi:phosphoribosyl 1,2-cyclic phosphate phosphodiesterase [Rhodoligotrophos appendicifer]|uniref:MBL fold metallo-hydrolase n=1 Tax=Rhodoligotrophos appendicifer TaxID=987056 RepID=UPI001184EED7|nr:MBL fold metallo-hydrolase [Rhodoligotrophos appendicifer]
MSLRVTILGCGSSAGVPRIGNHWGVCDPENPKNRRRRCSILIEKTGDSGVTRILVDTTPDVREQLLMADVGILDGVIFTHDHADHCHGIDELRAVAINGRRRVRVWADERTMGELHARFGYCFETPPGSSYPPILTAHPIVAGEPVEIDGPGGTIQILPFDLEHGDIMALGLRIGNLAYTPDVNGIPDAALATLENLDIWVIDALRPMPHPTHFDLETALLWIERMHPRRAVLTNMHIDLDYAQLRRSLPAHIEPAFDGMQLDLTSPQPI